MSQRGKNWSWRGGVGGGRGWEGVYQSQVFFSNLWIIICGRGERPTLVRSTRSDNCSRLRCLICVMNRWWVFHETTRAQALQSHREKRKGQRRSSLWVMTYQPGVFNTLLILPLDYGAFSPSEPWREKRAAKQIWRFVKVDMAGSLAASEIDQHASVRWVKKTNKQTAASERPCRPVTTGSVTGWGKVADK